MHEFWGTLAWRELDAPFASSAWRSTCARARSVLPPLKARAGAVGVSGCRACLRQALAIRDLSKKKEPGIAASRLLRLPFGSKTFRKVAQAFRKRSHAAFRHRKPAQFRQPSIRRDGSSASGLTSRSGRRAASRCVGLLALELNPVSVPESGRSEGHKQRNNCATPSIVQTHASRWRANHFAKSNGFRPLLSL